MNDGRLQDGDDVVLTAFGAGFAWGAGLVRWRIPSPNTRNEVRREALHV
jgi:hypothetical protein